MDNLIKLAAKSRVTASDFDYHLLRTSMIVIFLFFGFQKWFEYEAQVLIPYISNGPLIFWMYPVFGVRGASWFLGISEWIICALLFICRILEQKVRNSWCHRFNRNIHYNRHYYPIHAKWLG